MVLNRASLKQAFTVASGSTGLCAIVFSLLGKDFGGSLPISVFTAILVAITGMDLMGKPQPQSHKES